MEDLPYKVYVLRSLKDKMLYKGITDNLEERLRDHQKGRVPSTKYRRPMVFLYCESYRTRAEARAREKYFKSGPGHKLLISILLEKGLLSDASR